MGKIADISKYQGVIDWRKASGELDFCILRASCGEAEDTKFFDNVNGCIQHNVPFGVYHYVKAGTATAAIKEANFFYRTCQRANRQPAFYVADIEYEAQTAETTDTVCIAFINTLHGLGCEKVGLYINTRYKWARQAISLADFMWIPHWGKNDGQTPADKYKSKNPHDLWQYTSKGRLAGVKGNIDLNVLTGSKPMSYFTEQPTTVPEVIRPPAGGEPAPEEPKGSDSSMLTNVQLANYALAAYARRWVYWYGTYGNLCTQSRFEGKRKQYPSHYQDSRKAGYMKDIEEGRTCADCVGLIKGAFWSGGNIDATPKYSSNGCPDKGADSMFALCKEKGPISTIPDIPGLVVHKKGHIGVYVGGGYTVEMKGFAYDCVRAKVEAGPWTEWGKLSGSMIQWVTGEVTPPKYKLGERVLQKGDTGDDVVALQNALMKLGFELPRYGADGDFGTETRNAVKALQGVAQVEVTGVFDTATLKAMNEMLNPTAPDPSEETQPSAPEPPEDKLSNILIIEGNEENLKAIQQQYGGTLAEVII